MFQKKVCSTAHQTWALCRGGGDRLSWCWVADVGQTECLMSLFVHVHMWWEKITSCRSKQTNTETHEPQIKCEAAQELRVSHLVSSTPFPTFSSVCHSHVFVSCKDTCRRIWSIWRKHTTNAVGELKCRGSSGIFPRKFQRQESVWARCPYGQCWLCACQSTYRAAVSSVLKCNLHWYTCCPICVRIWCLLFFWTVGCFTILSTQMNQEGYQQTNPVTPNKVCSYPLRLFLGGNGEIVVNHNSVEILIHFKGSLETSRVDERVMGKRKHDG